MARTLKKTVVVEGRAYVKGTEYDSIPDKDRRQIAAARFEGQPSQSAGGTGGSTPATKPLSKQNLEELRATAAERGVEFDESDTKAQLVAKIEGKDETPDLEALGYDDLKALAHDQGVEVADDISKEDLVAKLQEQK